MLAFLGKGERELEKVGGQGDLGRLGYGVWLFRFI